MCDEDLQQFELTLLDSLPYYEEAVEVDDIEAEAIKRNAERYSKKSSSTELKPRFFQLVSSSFTSRYAELSPANERCINGDCGAGYEFLQDLPHCGNVVCRNCGAVQLTQIIQELQPFFWAFNPAHGSGGFVSRSGGISGSSYQPKFHWNEDEKLRSLTAPPIPVFNRRVIFAKLRAMGYGPQSEIINPKLVIQKACRLIDQENRVHIYGRKWGEHWMNLVSQFTHGRLSPPIQSEEEKADFSAKFEWFCSAWPMCSYLLPGSRKDVERSQLPQFRWIFRQFLITFFPQDFDQWARWLPALSKNKEIELDLFWKRVCFVNGWVYIPVDSFLLKIKSLLKIRKSRNKKRKL